MPRAAHAFMALLFFFGAVVQYNDPDPLRWMAIYLGASVACALAAVRRGRPALTLAAVVCIVALAWGALLAPGGLGAVQPGELVGAWEMKDAAVETGREMYGLFIIAAWMVVVVVTERRRLSSSSAGPGAKRATSRPSRG